MTQNLDARPGPAPLDRTPPATGATIDPERWPDVAAVHGHRWRGAVADRLFDRVVDRLPVRVRLPDGSLVGAGSPRDPLLVLHDPEAFARRVGGTGLIGFGESYMAGDWDAPDLAAVLTVFARRLSSLVPAPLQRLRQLALRAQPGDHRGSREGSRRNIAAHYDLSNDLFATFLDPSLSYSSGLFAPGELPGATFDALEAAQHRKIDRLLDAAGVGEGSRVLEIGTGWGELAVRAASRGATVLSVTLSVEQQALARARIAAAGYADRVDVEIRDYRDVVGEYDAVVSVEMIEAVGHEFWSDYFTTLHDRLRPGGLAALQAITMPHDRMVASRDTFTWIQKYIFPGGLIPSTESILANAEQAGLFVEGRLAFGRHYAETLRLWRERFEAAADDVARLGFDEVFRRMWSLYLAYSEAGFTSGYLDVQQVLLRRPPSPGETR